MSPSKLEPIPLSLNRVAVVSLQLLRSVFASLGTRQASVQIVDFICYHLPHELCALKELNVVIITTSCHSR